VRWLPFLARRSLYDARSKTDLIVLCSGTPFPEDAALMNGPSSLGIIAGSRALPLVLATAARHSGIPRLVAVGFTSETDPKLAELVDEMVWVRVGQLVKMIDAFRSRGVQHCVMAGEVSPKNLFDLRPDLRALALLLRLKERNARSIFGAIAEELHKDGVELIDARPWLKELIPEPGYRVGPKLSRSQQADVSFGFRLAKEVSRLEIGQTVVVKKGTVLAVEGFEGTDGCLKRGGELAGSSGGAVAVKVASDQHDFRFDIPCLGLQTLQVCRASNVQVLAFEGEKSLLLDREPLERAAIAAGITLVAV